MTAKLDYGIFDCDTHCYETRDAFTRYLPKEFHDRAIAPVRGADGKEVILAGHRVATFNSEAGLGFDLAYRPGSLKEMLKQMGSGNPDESYEPQPMQPEFLEREPPLEGHGAAERRTRRHLPGRNGACRRALRRRHRGSLRQSAIVQPMVRRNLGLQLPGQDLRHRAAFAARSGVVHRRDRSDHRAGRAHRAAAHRTRLRSLAGRSLLRPDLRATAGSRLHAGRSISSRTGTSTPSHRTGGTIPIPPPGTCRPGNG